MRRDSFENTLVHVRFCPKTLLPQIFILLNIAKYGFNRCEQESDNTVKVGE